MATDGTARHIEIERKLDAPDGFALPDLTGLPGVASAGEPVVHSLDATYFDTDDLRLIGARLTLRRRTGGIDAGWHLKRPGVGDARTEERHPLGRATRTVPPALRAAVEVHARGAQIGPVVRLRTTRAVRPLLDADGAVLVAVDVDAVSASVPSANGRWTTLTSWNELEVELVGGKPKLLEKVVARLVESGATPSTTRSKLARALAEAGRLPEHAGAGPARPDEGTAAAVVLDYLTGQVAHLEDQDPLVRADEHDAVHQMRVACRRLRSALATYRPLFDREAAEAVRADLQWLGEVLGAARDAEVVRDHLRGLAEAEPPELLLGPVVRRIVETMSSRYRAAHDEVLVDLAQERYFAVLDRLDAFLAEPPFTDVAAGPAPEVLLPLVDKTFTRTRRLVDATHAATDPHEHDLLLHEVRKAAKRARYAGESLTAAFGKDAKAFARQMARLQEVLGEHQDSVVIRGYLREMALAAYADGENAFSYGRLHALEQVRGQTTERDFDAAWAEASDPMWRAWLG